MKVLFEIKSVFGKKLIYPYSETAKLLTELTGKQTIDLSNLKTIIDLGYTIEVRKGFNVYSIEDLTALNW